MHSAIGCFDPAQPARAVALTESGPVEVSFLYAITLHDPSQYPVEPRLIALAAAPQPGDDIGVDPHRELPFDGSIEGIAYGSLPELVGQRRNIRIVDALVGPSGERIQSGLLFARDGRYALNAVEGL